MLNPKVYEIIATNLIKRIIERGNADLESDSGVILSAQTRDDGSFAICVCVDSKDTNTWLETTDANAAAKHYIDAVGAFAAMGDATKFFREHK